jgi:hypothetical protein
VVKWRVFLYNGSVYALCVLLVITPCLCVLLEINQIFLRTAGCFLMIGDEACVVLMIKFLLFT